MVAVAPDVKVFDFTDDEDEVGSPIPFKITYQRKEYKKESQKKDAPMIATGKWVKQTEDFHAVPTVPAGLTMSTLASFSQRGAVSSAAVLEYLQRAIIEEDRIRFQTLIDDDDVKMKMQNLAEITDWLMTEYAERPTQSA